MFQWPLIQLSSSGPTRPSLPVIPASGIQWDYSHATTLLLVALRGHVTACQICIRNKSTNCPQSGFLQPLEVSGWSWSHILLDFVTGLPPSQGKTTILTIIDHFSKAAHFIPLDKLPSFAETADLHTNHVFWLHGIPSEIVSDRGPQFISQVWKSFCTALGAKVSLSSGYQSIRSLRLHSVVLCVTIHPPGANKCAGWNTHIIP